ncbi:MAG: type II toxin-antitoxin system RelE/ParE family toxin [Roseburia sp.]|nr:type II toxin-antitoxin system RelE/ParE family toxin [Roseburia sp.]
MKYAVVFTDTAKSDLRNIAVYIVEQSKDKEIAKRFVKELSEQCAPLEEFPQIGALPKDRVLVSSGYRFLVHKEYLIVYSVDESNGKVYIQAVFNAKKDYTRMI